MKKRLVPALLLLALVCALFTVAIPAAEAPLFAVAYNANGGEGTMAASTHTSGAASALTKNTFTKDGYDFAGWATTPGGNVVYADQAEIAEAVPALGGKLILDEDAGAEVVFTADDEGILLDWKVKSGSKLVAGIVTAFTYDSSVLQLVDASGNAVTIPEGNFADIASTAQLSSHAAMTFPNSMYAVKGEGNLVHFSFERGSDTEVEIALTELTSLGTCRLAYQSGKSAADVTADTLCIASAAEAALLNGAPSFYLSDLDANEYIYADTDFTAETTLYAVWEEAAAGHTHAGVTAEWQTLPAGGALTSGYYFAEENLSLTAALTVAEGQDVVVCLNGMTLSPATGNTANAFVNNGNLTICDCGTAVTKGYIDPTTNLWTAGESVPENGVAVDLTGGIITGFQASAIRQKAGTFTLESGNIAGNASAGNGGAAYVDSGAYVVMTGGAMVGNTAPTNGGAIRTEGGHITITKTGDKAPYIAYNTAGASGGGLYIDGTASAKGSITMDGALVEKNTAGETKAGAGGGLFVDTNCTTDIKNSTFFGNYSSKAGDAESTANGRGGGLLCYSKLNMTDCVVKDNTAERQGGGIYASAGGAELLRVTVEGNESLSSTGGAYLSAAVTATDCVIKNNVSAGNSGGIQNYAEASSVMVLNNCTITGNVSNSTSVDLAEPYGGGGIYVSKLSTVTLNGCTISGNSAGKAGGGILVRGNLIINAGTEFSANNLTAAQTWTVGGLAMYVARTGNVTMNGGKIINHTSTTASRKGVAIHSAGTFTMNAGEISGNTATQTNFGVVSVFEGTFTMKGGSIKNNSANKVDGTVYVYGDPAAGTNSSGGHFYMEGGEISGNASRRGVLYVTGANASAKISGGTFKGNSFSDTSSTSYAQIFVGSSASLEIIGGTFLTTDGTSVLNVTSHVPAGYEQNTTTGTVAKASNAINHPGHAGLETWVALPTSGALASGNYVLTEDMQLTGSLSVKAGEEVHICLNGHTLTAAASKRHLANAGELTICDCTANTTKGYIDASTHLWKKGDAPSGATAVDVKGGILTGGNYEYGGAIYNTGKLLLTGVTLAGNQNLANGNGGAVFCTKSGSVTITEGTYIVGNVVKNSGGAIGSEGNFTMTGGLVAYNFVTTGNWTTHGAALALTYGEHTISGGEIRNNECLTNGQGRGGGIAVGQTSKTAGIARSKLTISGDTKVIDNNSIQGAGIHVSYTGDLVVNGGTIANNKYIANGTSTVGDIFLHNQEGTAQAGTVTIKGGTVGHLRLRYSDAKDGKGVACVVGSCTVTGGTIKNLTFDSNSSGKLKPTLSFTGGIFYSGTAVVDVKAHLTAGYGQMQNGQVIGNWLPDATGAAMMITGTFNGVEVTAYFSDIFAPGETANSSLLKWAASADANGKATLLADYDYAPAAKYILQFGNAITGNLTLDLGGKTLTLHENMLAQMLGTATLTVQNGAVVRAGATKTGTAIFQIGGDSANPLDASGNPYHPVLIVDGVEIYNNAKSSSTSPIFNSKTYVVDITIRNGSKIWNDLNQVPFYFDIGNSFAGKEVDGKATLTVTDSIVASAGNNIIGKADDVPKYEFALGNGAQVLVASAKNFYGTPVINAETETVVPGASYVMLGDETKTIGGTGYKALVYNTLAANALANKAGSTMKLLKDTTAGDVVLTAGTLDLNGKVLTVDSLIADTAELADSTNSTGLLKVGGSEGNANMTLNPANAQLAIGNLADGFRFSEVAFAKNVKENGNTASYAFNFYLRNDVAEAWLKENAATATLSAVVTWNGQSKEFDVPATVTGIEGSPVAFLLNNPAAGLRLTLSGIESFEDINVAAQISSNGVDCTAAAETVNAAN